MSATQEKQTLGFQTEVKQLLHLMIHSLYSNKEIFLRELVSNASDACDKLRFEAIADGSLYEGEQDLNIHIAFDDKARTITIRDNGIGMSRQEVIDNIGTIAKSGTKQFLQSLTGDQARDANLIGQFGVGFYSAFIIADKVSLHTRRAGSEESVLWESAGEGEFTLENKDKGQHGTEITLHLREGEDEFLNEFRLKNIIHKYSDHITFPIYMDKAEGEPEQANKASALWTRAKSDISDEEYNEFYKHVAHDFEEPLTHVHSRVEGKLEYTSLLYVPKHAPFDMWDRDSRHGIKLYVKRVFIMDDAEHLMPNYMRFVRGVIDSSDLPLNVSREILQHNKVVDSIRSGSVKKVLDMLAKLAKDEPEKYQGFWEQFGRVLKEGPGEDFANRERIAELLRFASTHDDKPEQTISLDQYKERMQEGQKAIYYITADSFNAAKNSPHLEIFRKKGIEVLLLSDRVDEWLVSSLTEYKELPLQSVTRGQLDLGELDEEQKQAQEKSNETYKDLIDKVKTVLGDKVKDVRMTQRLTNSPSCLVSDEADISSNLERILKQAGQNVPTVKPIFELNPEHPLVAKLHAMSGGEQFDDWSNILYEQALLAEGGQLDDPASYVARLNKMLLSLSA